MSPTGKSDILSVWKNCFKEAQETLENFLRQPDTDEKLVKFTNILTTTLQAGGTIFTCGNGGSHCDSMHFAEELTGRYRKDRRPLGALALGDPSHVTCVANDFGFEHIFERQIRALGRKGDCLILFTTSGKSQNQLLAAAAARERGLTTVGLLGRDGGKLREGVDLAIVVPGTTSDRIQEMHIKLVHNVIETVERQIFPELY